MTCTGPPCEPRQVNHPAVSRIRDANLITHLNASKARRAARETRCHFPAVRQSYLHARHRHGNQRETGFVYGQDQPTESSSRAVYLGRNEHDHQKENCSLFEHISDPNLGRHLAGAGKTCILPLPLSAT